MPINEPVMVVSSDRARVFVCVADDGAPILSVRLRGWDSAAGTSCWWTAFSSIMHGSVANDAALAAVRVLLPSGKYDAAGIGPTTKSGAIVALGDLLRVTP